MPYYVDTHCHLDLFKDIRSSVDREDNLPIKTITVTNTPALWAPNQKLFGESHNIRVALGLHPELAVEREHETDLFDNLCSKAKYIGEIGLDGTSKDKLVRDTQLKVFRRLLDSIKNSNPKVITVHSRGAAKETIDELTTALKGTQHQVILHWYSGSSRDLKSAVERGYFFSINHKMLSSKNGQNIIKEIPQDKLVTETDAPFTFTDKIFTREQSLREAVKGLATIWMNDHDQVRYKIWENFKRLLLPA
ncbi:Qat anti-phage system TatD family nuclease QatD [Pontibacter litorisediminis]|uniref:Qat anti-phage system TatD family nuclease QatD n=1 Tax=Pontibacter litorisediminis TaxID=1846260 RepID=UPI0023EDEE18|nr:Qat anti-phage system TatD family nuclease QatD [Pontibacter litorisediminis]